MIQRSAPRPLYRPKAPRPKPRLTYKERTFIWVSHQADHRIARLAGMTWAGPPRNFYWTRDWDVAFKLKAYADPACEEILGPMHQAVVQSLEASRATDADIDIPVPAGLSYMPFQKAGVSYGMTHPNVLIADEMGLGKTIQAIGLINADPEMRKVLIVCPASLKINWRRELERWLVRPLWVTIAGQHFPTAANIIIANYDVLHKFERAIKSVRWDLLIADECHLAKNPAARRSRILHSIPAKRRAYLSGTPIVNRPAELWPLIEVLAPKMFKDQKEYVERYCKATPRDVEGRRLLNELQTRLRATFMVRRLKAQVLTDLPPKMRQVIELPPGDAAGVVAKEQEAVRRFVDSMFGLRLRVELSKASDDPKEYETAVQELRMGLTAAFSEISKLRHETALAKVPAVIEQVREALEASGKVVLFAHHHDVIEQIQAAFVKVAVKVTGQVSLRDRQAAVDAFQKDPKTRLFIGGIQAAGVGLTLTASSHVIFAELDWVPGNMSQAEDRCHRIGQKDSVSVQHLVLEGSLDATMAKTLVNKQRVIDAALDAEKDELAGDPIVPLLDGFATEGVGRSRIERDAAALKEGESEAVHAALRVLGEGINRLDEAMARELTALPRLTPKQAALGRRIVRKYATKEATA